MNENDIHKCLLSYGFFPMTKILKWLENKERYEECSLIHSSMLSYKKRFKWNQDINTQWSKEFEEEYFSYFKKLDKNHKLIAKENLKYYIKDIKKRLKIKLNQHH